MRITLLDGPMGTELGRRGCDLPEGEWSAWALQGAPDMVRAIHQDYAAAGAQVHTANTFRTKRRSFPVTWERQARLAVFLAREALAPGSRLAGSMAPLEDCYRPDLSPDEPRAEHRELARVLADAGVDLLLCEAFPHAGEGLVAVEEAVDTGLPTWMAFTAGPEGELMTPQEMGAAAQEAVQRGAAAVLVNCVAAEKTLAYVEALLEAGVPVGAYANAGADWKAPVESYVAHARDWVAAGALIVGSCCGTGPAHVAALAALGEKS